MLNTPPSDNTTLDTLINMEYAGGTNVSMRDIMSTTKGPFCYIVCYSPEHFISLLGHIWKFQGPSGVF